MLLITKAIQTQVYNIIHNKQAIITFFIGTVLIIISAFHFGEVTIRWSKDRYASLFNVYMDNIAQSSFQQRLCPTLPVDVVYTWVNGSDYKLISELKKAKKALLMEQSGQFEEKSSVNSTAHSVISIGIQCRYKDCIETEMLVLEPALPGHVNMATLKSINPSLTSSLVNMFNTSVDSVTAVTVLVFTDITSAKQALLLDVSVHPSMNISKYLGYVTSEAIVGQTVKLNTKVLAINIEGAPSDVEIIKQLPEPCQTMVNKVYLNESKSIVLLSVNDDTLFLEKYHSQYDNATKRENMPPFTLLPGSLVWDFSDDVANKDDIASNRFQDNEELRYSLRSIERFAPWVHHVFIVTNGQIPSWLNLDSPRLSLVTHAEIFPNSDHLPTFSSPGIESHLHRIPGIADRFIYMNDDVLFGREVWPDDFYTHSGGYKVYLSWSVPNCADGCPGSWIKDGYCDKTCNTSACDWDGGDCVGVKASDSDNNNQHNSDLFNVGIQMAPYCNVGCADTWLADKYCDVSCNVLECGFDAGDCGTDRFKQLYGVDVDFNTSIIYLPSSVHIAYFNLTSLLGDTGLVTRASTQSNINVRALAVGQKYRVLTLILYPNQNATTVHVTLSVDRGEGWEMFQLLFQIQAHTVLDLGEGEGIDQLTVDDDFIPVVKIKEQWLVTIDPYNREPRIKPLTNVSVGLLAGNLSLDTVLPVNVSEILSALQQELSDGLLTEQGYQRKVDTILGHDRHPPRPVVTHDRHPPRPVVTHDRHPPRPVVTQPAGLDGGLVPVVNINQSQAAVVINQSQAGGVASNQSQAVGGGVINQSQAGVVAINQSQVDSVYGVSSGPRRRLLDTFGDSLRYVNKIYNKEFGYESRLVPSHMPHYIDKNIMDELHDRFPAEFDKTSSHRIRHSEDMQFAFSYYYFLMNEKQRQSTESLFDEYDTDSSGVWSDREIRLVATALFNLPLDLKSLTNVEDMLINCSHTQFVDYEVYNSEQYYDPRMPQVSKNLVSHCPSLVGRLNKTFGLQQKYKFQLMPEDEITFKMIRTNVSFVIYQLDDIRKNRKKFVCLNDNIDHDHKDSTLVKALLQDFYESIFPVPSQFELPREYRNRFLHMDDLHQWMKHRDILKYLTHFLLGSMIIITILSFCADRLVTICKAILPHRLTRQRNPISRQKLTA